MPKITDENIKKIRNLRKKGYSISEIEKEITDISRGSIWKYSQGIQLSKEQKERLKRKEDETRRKFVLKSTNKIKEQNPKLTLPKVRIIAHLLFDGFVNPKNYQICFTCSSPQILQQFINDIDDIYGLKNFTTEKLNDKGCKTIRFNSKLAIEDLYKYAKSFSCRSEEI